MTRKKPITAPEPLASERMPRPFPSSGAGTSFPTLEILDVRRGWEAHLAAGRIETL
jgi:hypothetical protein